MDDTNILPCLCGSTNIALVCTSGSHYEHHWCKCRICGAEGPAELQHCDARPAWNRLIHQMQLSIFSTEQLMAEIERRKLIESHKQPPRVKDATDLGLPPGVTVSELE